VNDLRPQLLRPCWIENCALPLTRYSGGEGDRKVRGIPFGEHRDFGSAAGGNGLRFVAETGPAEPLARHDDGGVVGAFIGPALESVEKRHRTNFTGGTGCTPAADDYCDNMSFNDGVEIDSSQVEDRRGGGMGRGPKIGGGIGGGVILLLAALFGINPGLLEGLVGSGQEQPGQSQGTAPTECKLGTDADRRLDCRITGTVTSLNAFWPAYLADYKVKYPRPKTVLFTGGTGTACGAATSEVGPFYCPADTTAYFDPGFFQELVDRFGSSGGPLAQEYVVAHEFGHHIQNILGDLDKAQQDPQGAQSGGVRVELQADCYAGLWTRYATTQKDPKTGKPFLEPLTQKDLNDALSAASAVGDDRIQKAATGRVSPEGWTHGSSAQRQKWYYQGYKTGDINQCDTFSAATL
jgi:predicted metalloprotease